MKDENERLLESNKILKVDDEWLSWFLIDVDFQMHLQAIIQMDQQLQQQQSSLSAENANNPSNLAAPQTNS